MTELELSRRRFLAGGAAAGAALVLAGRLPDRAAAQTGSVIVIGAGLAGLSAALRLRRAGLSVTVLEADERVGGRVLTVRLGGQHAEGGGEYIDTRHTEIRAYAREFRLRLEDAGAGYGGREDLVFRRGRRVPLGSFATRRVRAQMDRFYARVERLAGPLDPADPAVRGASLDGRSAADLLDDLRLGGRARFLLEAELRDDYAVEPARLSLLFVAASYRAAENQPDSGLEAFRIRGGNDRLPKAMAAALGSSLRLSSRVTTIEQSGSAVTVRTTAGDSVVADRCVVSAPLPALRGISFSPALAQPLADAVAGLQYGPITKTLLSYRRRFWRSRGFSGDLVSDLQLGSVWDATNAQRGRRGILIAYGAGRNARASKRAAASRAAKQIARVHPASAKLLDAGRVVQWASMPYAGGAYAAFAPGQVNAYWTAVRRSQGRLHFAGEHTAELTGYMEGAIRSGHRAAAEILAAG